MGKAILYTVVAYATLGAILYGYDGVYFSGVSALDVFNNDFGTALQSTGKYALSASQLSIMTSMINVGELVGSISAALINDRYGRRVCWIMASIFVILGCVLQICTESLEGFILGGRVILGCGVGAFAATGPIYIGEISPVHLRGPFLICWQMALSISQIVAACINQGVKAYQTSFSWRFPTVFQVLFPTLVLLGVWWIPESPRWLIRKGKLEGARKALELLHRNEKDYDYQQDIAQIHRALERDPATSNRGSWLELLTDTVERKKLMFSAGALIAQQINGIQWFYYFGTDFAKEVGISDPFLMTVIVFTIQLFVVTAAMLLSNKLPRRPLMLTCSCIMMFSIFMVGCMGIPSAGQVVPEKYGKVIMFFIILEICAANFSWGPLGWSIVSVSVQHLKYPKHSCAGF
ncbi:hypothetical protein CLAIMM_11364 [Cladophialophora immunda]|nr:hypothetical protein CLAIMM_11364 [Cladophialophora immunda]